MFKIYDLVSIKNSKKSNTPLVICSVLGENKKQGVYQIEDIDGNLLNPIFLDEDLIEFEIDINSNELERRINFNYKDICKNLEDYNHEIISLKTITEEIIEDALVKTIKDIKRYHNGFNSHSTFNKLNSLSLEDKSIFIKDLEDYINLTINNSSYINIDNLLNISLKSYISHIFDINYKLILKKILLLYLNNFLESLNSYDIYCFCNHRENQMRTSKHFLLHLMPEDIIISIDEFLDKYEYSNFNDISLYKLENNYYEYLKIKFNIKNKVE